MKLINFVFNGTTSLKWSIFFIPVLHQRESYYSFINHEISLFLNILHMNWITLHHTSQFYIQGYCFSAHIQAVLFSTQHIIINSA